MLGYKLGVVSITPRFLPRIHWPVCAIRMVGYKLGVVSITPRFLPRIHWPVCAIRMVGYKLGVVSIIPRFLPRIHWQPLSMCHQDGWLQVRFFPDQTQCTCSVCWHLISARLPRQKYRALHCTQTEEQKLDKLGEVLEDSDLARNGLRF